MPPINPADASYLLQLHVMRDMDNVNVMQKCLDMMVRDAQQGLPLDKAYNEIQGGKLGQDLVWTRQYIQGMQQYIAQAQAAIAEGGTSALDFLRSATAQTAAIGEQAMAYVESHPAESATLAGATGQAGIQLAQAGSGTATAGTGTATAAGAAEGSTVAAGAVAEGSTVAAGAVAEGSTIAAGAVAETVAVTGTAVAAETGAGATLAAGATGGSWLGPVGIAVGLSIAAAVLTIGYLATHKDKPTQTVAVATVSSSSSNSSVTTFSSSSSSKSSGSGSSSSDTDSSSSDSGSSTDSSSGSDSSSSESSSSSGGGAGLKTTGVWVITEDVSQRSTGAPSPDDPLGCANRRLPDELPISKQGNGLNVQFPETPGGSPVDHSADLDSAGNWTVPYPDVGSEMDGSFVDNQGETDIVNGHLYSGDCTFFFSARPKT